MSQSFQKIGILGGGLLGGSVVLALREQADVRLWFRKAEAIVSAREMGFACATANLSEAVSGLDLLILAVPVGAMPSLLSAAVAAGLPKDCIVTDVGSVKVAPHRDLAPILANSCNPFIGSHPMAGSERNGLAAARGDLFQNAACLLTNDSSAALDLCEKLENFWISLGCHTRWLGASDHDRLVARISHLPHVTAAATAFAALSANASDGQFSGGGLRDTTRVAGGNPEMWAEILYENRAEVARSVGETIAKLDEFLIALNVADQKELLKLLVEAKAFRDTLS